MSNEFEVNVDVMSPNGGQGEVASELIGGGRLNIGAMKPFIAENGKPYISVYMGGKKTDPKNYKVVPIQTNATLRRDEWKLLDEAVITVARDRLIGINDLVSNNLVYNLGNPMGTTVLEWHDVSDSMEAVITMDGVTRGKGDRPKFQHNYLPIPIIHVDYEINARALAASRNMGNPLDTTSAEHAARRIAEKLEDMLFTSTTYSWGETDSRSRNTIYSYVNHPDRNTVTLSANWDASGKTGAQIIADVLDMKQASINAKHYGPNWMLYIPTAYETVLDEDYDSTTPGTTIRERIMKISGIKGIKVVDRLTANNVLLIEMRTDVVRLINGLSIQNIEWQTEGRFVNKYKVITIQVPQIRSDQDGNSGIVHLSA